MGFLWGCLVGIALMATWYRVKRPPGREHWQYLWQSAPIAYLEVDQENRLCWANSLAEKLLGIKLTPRRLLLQIVRSYELDQLIQETRLQQVALEKSWVHHLVSPNPLESLPSLHLRAYSIPLPQGHVGVFLEDRCEAVQLAQQRDRWTADVAHELKTPLTSMRLVVETLQDRSPPDLRPWLDRLLKELIRLSDIVADLLDLGQQDMGKVPTLNLSRLDLPYLLHQVWQTLEPLAQRKQISLHYVGPAQLELEGDEARLHRLFLNLLDNAIKFSPPNQPVRLEVTPGTEIVTIDIIDYGSGFSAEDLPHIFDRFYRADPSRSRPDVGLGGSGLGLAIVKQSVLLHQGSIKANNHPDTQGAWISLTLPLRQERRRGDSNPRWL
ncbi:MAG: HAMP domain-containing sensor histidine kinase [Pseudanabaenaceae cyanobacterium SKYGB_i_bin29]|nr:HAMP domain-containing histidine kinase [Pseudanabaenaceae cyanobacterium SKYG29]MDW8422511.1 HAMP domain-containing sensor histidine kinase [Pseudanabaenaceae cyanobacterium SKYGB_i_bin29]